MKNWRYYLAKYVLQVPEGFESWSPNMSQKIGITLLCKTLPRENILRNIAYFGKNRITLNAENPDKVEDLKKYIKVLKFEKNKNYVLFISKDSGLRLSDLSKVSTNFTADTETQIILVDGDVDRLIKLIGLS